MKTDLTFIDVNPAYARIFGYKSPEELMAHATRLDQAIDISARHRKLIEDALQREGLIQGYESNFKRANGESAWISLSVHVVKDVSGNVLYEEGTVVDITEKKSLEAQMLRAQRLESIGTLASGIAHDLNNVLGPIMMAVQILRDRHKDKESQSILTTLETSAIRGAGIVKQVLMFARGAEGERILIDPKHLIKDLRSIVQETFPRSISFEAELWPGLWQIHGDLTQIHQVLLNLCVNARDAMPQGGSLKLIAANEMVDETKARLHPGAQAGPFAVIAIADTGTGIHPEVLDRIFDPFFTTKPIGKGTGLGLSTAVGIVRSHHGFIEVTSVLNRGTKFKVYFPAVEHDAESPGIRPEADAPNGSGLILVIDDEESICIITKATLESAGYDVITAPSGDEALKLYNARWKEIKAVVTDFMMPGMDGAATLQALRQINPNVKVIVTSGLADNIDLSRIEALHAQAFLTKPYPASQILQALHDVVGSTK